MEAKINAKVKIPEPELLIKLNTEKIKDSWKNGDYAIAILEMAINVEKILSDKLSLVWVNNK